MHKLTEKLLAAGVIPAQAVSLLKLWNSDFEELPDDIKQVKTQDELLRLVDEMAKIIEEEEEVPELRETEFDLEETKHDLHEVSVEVNAGSLQKLYLNCALGKTVGGRYIYFLRPTIKSDVDHMVATRGNIITDRDKKYIVMSVEPRYTDDRLTCYVLTVEEIACRSAI
jgi:hypothetical protein